MVTAFHWESLRSPAALLSFSGFAPRGEAASPAAPRAAVWSWRRRLIGLLAIEKVIQHLFVTWALYVDFMQIRSTVAVSPDGLMIAGGLVAVLFAIGVGGLWRGDRWALPLIFGLALFDFVGEFVAQGKIAIIINVSFLVALALMGLAFLERRAERTRRIAG